MKSNITEGVYVIQQTVSNRFQDESNHAWEIMYQEAGRIISNFSMSNPGKYVVSRLVQHYPHDKELAPWQTVLRLNIELYLSSTSKIVMHEFVYSRVTGDPVEWMCGHCGLPNEIHATFCGEKHKSSAGCGAPRDFLRDGETFNQYFIPTTERI